MAHAAAAVAVVTLVPSRALRWPESLAELAADPWVGVCVWALQAGRGTGVEGQAAVDQGLHREMWGGS
jgi:hypothetical protein